jgi:PAS domain S-box-containing protein
MPFLKFGDAHEARLYRTLVKELPDYALFRISPEGRMETWNAGVERVLGYTESEFLQRSFADLFTPDEQARKIWKEELETAAREGRSSDERWHVRKDGQLFYADGLVTPIIDNDGKIVGFTKVMRDITERKRAQEQKDRLSAEISELAHALDLTHTVIRELDGTILVWTQGAEFLYGWPPEQARGRCSHDLLKTTFPEPLENINQRLLELGEWQGELTHTTRDGRAITVASHWVSHTERGRDNFRVIEVNNDISELKSIQSALEESNLKFRRVNAELASFAYEVAHDIRAPLRGITTFAELLSRSLEVGQPEVQRNLVGNVLESTKSLAQLVESLLQYATVENAPDRVVSVPLEDILSEVRTSLNAAIEESNTTLDWGPLPVVQAHPGRLLRLFQNLIANAINYARPGVSPVVHVSCECCDGCYLFHVSDNGVGIEPRFAETIFAPFKRLHGPNVAGTGLGLAICKRIVEGEGGRIWFDSVKDSGSTFHFTLPKPS